MGPYSAMLAYLVKVVTLPTPTHVANIANEWLPIQRYGRYTCCIIYKLKVKIKNPPPSIFWFRPILRTHIKIIVSSSSQSPKHYIFNFILTVYAMPALIGHASGFCGLYCTYGRATWGKSACTKLFIATLQI